ncbi:hypothetical protein GIB67_026330 [Kingdonia uniflora]|uniref:C2 domain-containing protein n=1 Tax=Kingdonia uniflora TaxID=39325 RepID=A0A7J7N620_9MAGN|nr:hypothetical protein GIB67_026330 [Kingdonia uniflora]
MGSGILEVLLVDACCLKDTDCFGIFSCGIFACCCGKDTKFIGKMDPYVLIHFGNEERKSKVARWQGGNPVWNEKFTFEAEYPGEKNDLYKLTFKIMDEDTLTGGDFVGESVIYVKDVISLGVEEGTIELPTAKYSVVLQDKRYYGDIRVGVKFIRKVEGVKEKDTAACKESHSASE